MEKEETPKICPRCKKKELHPTLAMNDVWAPNGGCRVDVGSVLGTWAVAGWTIQ